MWTGAAARNSAALQRTRDMSVMFLGGGCRPELSGKRREKLQIKAQPQSFLGETNGGNCPTAKHCREVGKFPSKQFEYTTRKKGFGLDMSGMSLMPSFGGADFRGGEMEDNGQQDHHRIVDSGDSVHSMRSSNASPEITGLKGGIHRPPGLGVAVPSPIGKPGHSYTSSASTAQNLTLTPTSSLDGGEMYARQSSPFHGDGPSLSSTEMPPGFSSMGSYDEEDGEHDGLLGLQALRDRAHSAPGPTLGHVAAFDDGRTMRPRTVSRDNGRSQSAASRPPLSGNSGSSPHTTESKSYYPGPGTRSRDHSPTPPGVISRPGMLNDPQPDRLYDPSRSRSIGSDSGRDYNQPSMDQLAQKFVQLGNQPHMGHPPQNFAHIHQDFNRHQRASSMPGPMRANGSPQDQYQEEMAHVASRRGSDYGIGMSSNMYHGADGSYSDMYNPHPSQYVQEQVGRPQIINQRRSSLQNVPGVGAGFYGQGHNVHRRESLDFVPGHNRHPDGVPVVASNEEMRMYMSAEERSSYRRGAHDRMVSPGHSQVHYGGGHSRHPSDMGNSTLSSSPASLSSSGGGRGMHGHDMYVGNSRGRHRVTPSDDDLSHPLVGEHIDVYGDDRGYPPHEIPEHPHGQGSRIRTVSGDQSLPHYGGAAAAHVQPGSALPMPKIVYNIKFKRTQRTFVLGPRLNRDLKVGTYVKVEADRGEDLGIVIGRVPSEQFMSNRSSFHGGVGEMGAMPPPSGMGPTGAADLKRIVRLATHDEVALLNMKREEEDELLKICRAKVRQRALNMNVVDAEYQFDRHKLTFFFEAEGRVDFRELVRDLFSMYKTRIWMQQLDKTTTATCPTAPEEDPAVEVDYGTPILAPESEYSGFTGGSSGDSTD